jgi:hypothetical protein
MDGSFSQSRHFNESPQPNRNAGMHGGTRQDALLLPTLGKGTSQSRVDQRAVTLVQPKATAIRSNPNTPYDA